jgi:hypothetical protein
MAQGRIGGSFAPPLTDELLVHYEAMLSTLDPKSQLADAFKICLNCCKQWWEQPESVGPGKPHPVGVGTIVDLDAPIAAALWEHIPWDDELNVMGQVFEKIDPIAQRELRNAAHHLLWHAKELVRDREPLTADKL